MDTAEADYTRNAKRKEKMMADIKLTEDGKLRIKQSEAERLIDTDEMFYQTYLQHDAAGTLEIIPEEEDPTKKEPV
jgi:hypothetical protein